MSGFAPGAAKGLKDLAGRLQTDGPLQIRCPECGVELEVAHGRHTGRIFAHHPLTRCKLIRPTWGLYGQQVFSKEKDLRAAVKQGLVEPESIDPSARAAFDPAMLEAPLPPKQEQERTAYRILFKQFKAWIRMGGMAR